MRAVILASGRGARLAPLTDALPKPLLPVTNRPILEYLLHSLARAGVSEVLITIGYLASQLEQFLTAHKTDLTIQTIPAPHWTKGPIFSFQATKPFLQKDEIFLLLPSDLHIPASLLQQLLNQTGDEWMVLYDPHQFRPGPMVQLDSAGQVKHLSRSLTATKETHPLLPLLRISFDIFQSINHASLSKATTIFDVLQYCVAQNRSLRGLSIDSVAWFDIDKAADLIHLNYHLLSTDWPPTPEPPGTYLPPKTEMSGPLKSNTLTLGSDSQLVGPVLLGPRVHIGEGCLIGDGTTLGAYTTVHNNSSLKGCISFPHTHVPTNVNLTNTVLDKKGHVVH